MPAVVFCSDDLMFASQVRGAAERHQLACLVTAAPASLAAAMADADPPRLVILDLTHPGSAIEEWTEAAHAGGGNPQVIAYGPHVESELLRNATVAGCDVVLTRSQFHQQLMSIMSRLASD